MSTTTTSKTTNRTRRSRGYNFEYDFVKFFNQGLYQARRLGGSSTGLPDVVITNNVENFLDACELKSVSSDYAYVPNDQIMRCLDVLNMFKVYQFKAIIFAFKFSRNVAEIKGYRNKRTGKTTKRKVLKRKLRYHFFRIPYAETTFLQYIKTLRCDYEGNLTVTKTDEDKMITFQYNRFETMKVLMDFRFTPTMSYFDSDPLEKIKAEDDDKNNKKKKKEAIAGLD